MAVTN